MGRAANRRFFKALRKRGDRRRGNALRGLCHSTKALTDASGGAKSLHRSSMRVFVGRCRRRLNSRERLSFVEYNPVTALRDSSECTWRSVLLAGGAAVIGIDNLQFLLRSTLEHARLGELARDPGFRFEKVDIADRAT